MAERDIRERDILVAPNEYAYVQDLTKGNIVLYVGPTKISLSNTERLIVLDDGRFVPVRGEDSALGVHRFVEATSSQYIIVENPPIDDDVAPVRGANSAVSLRTGRKIVVPGPAEFSLWPGQRAQVVDGHQLRPSEYLVVRVYDEIANQGPIGTEIIVRGDDVSFYIPKTGLQVVPDGDRYVRKAWRMDSNTGLHLRVISSFEATERDQVSAGVYLSGQDIFLRAREGFFFPTDNLEVLAKVSPIPLAEKEAIYVRDQASGEIATVEGPTNYLVDPTREEIVDRRLDEQRTALYGLASGRSTQALSIYIPPSTAVMVTAKNRREVVVGPQTRILNFDEDLEILTLSTGRPKSTRQLLPTCFLQIQGNKVSDVVRIKTADHVELDILLSYRVSFIGDSENWFSVKDYVGLLCDHLGSIIRAAARNTNIDTFYATSTEIVRNAVLGTHQESGSREGRHFKENGMWVYDVEVLDVHILDDAVKTMLCDAQRLAIASTIQRKQEQLRLGDQKLKERVDQELYETRKETLCKATEFEEAQQTAERLRTEAALALDKLKHLGKAAHKAQAVRIESEAQLAAAKGAAELRQRGQEADVAAFRQQMEALQPELIATLKTLSNKQLAGELTKNLAPLAILGGESVADVVGRLLERLPLGPSEHNGVPAEIQALLGAMTPIDADRAAKH